MWLKLAVSGCVQLCVYLRPEACGAEDLERQRKLAAIIEMLHTATLVHDDVVDESGLRRGRPTANATWNNQTAVLVGDFLISRAFDLLVDLNDLVLLKDFQRALVKLPKVKFYNYRHSINLTPQNKFI